MTADVLALVGVLALAAAGAWLWRRRDGRTVRVDALLGQGVRQALGVPAEGPALLLFTTPTCGNCDAARAVLAAVREQRPDVVVAEVDVASHADVARDHRVLRAPTVLVVDERDAIRARVSGIPDRGDLVDVLAA